MKASSFLNDFSRCKVNTSHIAPFSPILLNLSKKHQQSKHLLYLYVFLTLGKKNILKSILYHLITKPRPSRRNNMMRYEHHYFIIVYDIGKMSVTFFVQ